MILVGPSLSRYIFKRDCSLLENEIQSEWNFQKGQSLLLALKMERATWWVWLVSRSWKQPPADSSQGSRNHSPTTARNWVLLQLCCVGRGAELYMRMLPGWHRSVTCETWAVKLVSLSLDFWHVELWANKLVLFWLPSLWLFVMPQ